MIKKIKIEREFDFEELKSRLRQVSLRGFPDVKIYQDSRISIQSFSPVAVSRTIFTPQPSVYSLDLSKVNYITEMFRELGVDIFRLNGGVDYFATDDKGEETEWTIIPPVIEMAPIRHSHGRGLDFSTFIGPELKALIKEKGYRQNSELKELSYPEYAPSNGRVIKVPEICDGSHRIEIGRRKGGLQNILVINNVTPGFPYYAAPQPYSAVHEEQERIEDKLDKVHILTSPGHKQLYRLFPSGGINNGNVRATNQGFD